MSLFFIYIFFLFSLFFSLSSLFFFFYFLFFFFFKQKTAYEMLRSLVGSEMCIRDRSGGGGSVAAKCTVLRILDSLTGMLVEDYEQLLMGNFTEEVNEEGSGGGGSSASALLDVMFLTCLLYTSDAATKRIV
eukprot:TRINITY_DN47588_c0_g1_i1.p1 TRINITY_DN47588_c0_g1~~TRINITY_DN47588_c0_g1_i1.p1  ORF type:complete len:132 (+),score=70.77 TRINITY_DN47588_c0_g1_i1:3-398(+)